MTMQITIKFVGSLRKYEATPSITSIVMEHKKPNSVNYWAI
ncbi:hypothetical protein VCRA2122O265_290068 [Vibrio crassostreae]|nr:hypothetical protein VCRA2118O239_260061 [Vibrio crassostreae]CAK1954106.1 hypothetical protein VCRA2112O184_260032 [Vibrio crassostreae]CAK1960955.1 hypothetical protein VCRA2113O218_280046 [Vibrio crassostreae]CAK1971368.1 hypothetical protein VCRA2113O194_270062 [Vibrio crassostreae]CAK1976205.1 hypothetical protein VCRA2113O212_270062 [Vibrio crassostreae]